MTSNGKSDSLGPTGTNSSASSADVSPARTGMTLPKLPEINFPNLPKIEIPNLLNLPKLPEFALPSFSPPNKSAKGYASKSTVDTLFATKEGDSFFAKLADETIGTGADSALKQLKATSEEVLQDLFGPTALSDLNYPLAMSGAMLAAQVHRDGRYPEPPSSGVPFTDQTILHAGARYACFAHAAYADGAEKIAAELGLDAKHIHYVHTSTGVGCPNFVIATDPVAYALVLAIRGSASLADVLTDVTAKDEPFLGGYAHAGILKSSQQVADVALPVIKELFFDKLLKFFDERPPTQLVITGHSLGASTAILTSIVLCGKGGPLHHFSKTGAIKVFAYAPSPPFGPASVVPSWVQANTYCFINRFDLVPRVTLTSTMKLLLALKHVDGIKTLSATDRLAYLLAPGPARPTHVPHLPDCLETSEETKEKWKPMLGVGRLLLLLDKPGPRPVPLPWFRRAAAIASFGLIGTGTGWAPAPPPRLTVSETNKQVNGNQASNGTTMPNSVTSITSTTNGSHAPVSFGFGFGERLRAAATRPAAVETVEAVETHVVCEEVHPVLLDFIVLHRSMVHDHGTRNYMEATANAAGLPCGLGAKCMWEAEPSLIVEAASSWLGFISRPSLSLGLGLKPTRPALRECFGVVRSTLRRLGLVATSLPAPPAPSRLPGLSDVSWALGALVGVQCMLILTIPGSQQLLRRRFPRVLNALLR